MGRFLTIPDLEIGMVEHRLMWQHIKPAGRPGDDATLFRAYALATHENCVFEVPTGAEVQIVESAGSDGQYVHTFVCGVHVHARGGLVMKPGMVVRGRTTVYMKVSEPVGARERGEGTRGRNAYARYQICVNIEPHDSASARPSRRMEIMDTTKAGYYRHQSHMIGPEQFAVYFALGRNVVDAHVIARPIQHEDQIQYEQERRGPGNFVVADAMREAGLIK
jgi:hypothetical protein